METCLAHLLCWKMRIRMSISLRSALRLFSVKVCEPCAKIRTAYPQPRLLADLKIMDAGEAEADIAFGAGADIVTVMGVSGDETIQGALISAVKHDGQVMIDMMQLADPLERADRLIGLGCNLLCLHTAHDQQSTHGSPWRQLAQLRQAYPSLHLAIAGGVNLKVLPQIMPLHPQIIVVGSAITAAADPKPCRPFNS